MVAQGDSRSTATQVFQHTALLLLLLLLSGTFLLSDAKSYANPGEENEERDSAVVLQENNGGQPQQQRWAESPAHQYNIIYVKVPKAASSTSGGIFRRVADQTGRAGARQGIYDFEEQPGVWAHHLPYVELRDRLQQHLRLPYFLATFVREPADKAISLFMHFHVSRERKEDEPLEQPRPEELVKFLQTVADAEADYMCDLRHFEHVKRTLDGGLGIIHAAQGCLTSFDFVGVVERYDESLVVLKNMLNVSLKSLLYLPSKVSYKINNTAASLDVKSSSQDSTHHAFVPHLPLDQQPPTVQRYVREEFPKKNRVDFALYQAANQRLDEQISGLGGRFGADLKAFQALMKMARERCANKTTTEWKEAGECYWNDNGIRAHCNRYYHEVNLAILFGLCHIYMLCSA